MIGSSPRSSRAVALGGVALLALAACQREEARERSTTSIRVEITSPTDLGSEMNRLDDSARSVTVHLSALDDQGNVDTGFAKPVVVDVQYLGTLTPTGLNVMLTAGEATTSIALPPVLGPTYLWVEDTLGDSPSYATGTSPILWYRDPNLGDISTPDLTAPSTWLSDSPYEGKQVRVAASKHPTGVLVVTGVYAQGFTLSDVNCDAPTSPAAPCAADPFNHVFVFTFGRPRADTGEPIEIGHVISWVSGGVGEFNGYTELNFPQQGIADRGPNPADPSQDLPNPDETLVPDPVVVDAAWLNGPQDPTGMINLEEQESGLVAVENGILCPLDDDYTTYKQWKLDLGNGCGNAINIISAGQVNAFDPADYPAGTIFSRVIGTVRAVNIGTFNVWIVQPRRSSDITI